MREIKFRAWDGEKMLTQECLYWNGSVFVSGVWDFEETHIVQNEQEVDLMQYTGLKDKNGVEIYEGDIVKANHYPFYSDAPEIEGGKENPEKLNYLGVIGIDIDGVYYDLKVVSDRVSGRACGGSLSEIAEVVEVIGNTYENPELLEQKSC